MDVPSITPLGGLEGLGLVALNRLAGPSLKTLGRTAERWVEFRTRNVGRIAEKAAAKSEDRLDEIGSVPPRVVASLLEAGSWCDDDVMQEYLAGILAGSRTPEGGDDRGVYWTDLVSRLASVHIRAHYVIYRALRDLGEPGLPPLSLIEGQRSRSVYIPMDSWISTVGEPGDALGSSVQVLAREGLIGPEWGTGEPSFLRFPGAPTSGVHVAPTHVGIELFLWAHGVTLSAVDVITNRDFPLPDFTEHINPAAGALVGPMS